MKSISPIVLVACFTSIAIASEISYPGATLQKDPVEDGQSLYPVRASGNKVSIDYVPGGKVSDPDSAFGGFARNGTSEKNELSFRNGHVVRFVAGGASLSGDAKSNAVFFFDGLAADAAIGKLCGGQTKNGDVNDNSVTVSGGRIVGDVYGGDADANGNANGNRVEIDDGELSGFVNGGGVSGIGIARKNRVTVSGGKVEMGVAGGFAHFAAGSPPESTTAEKTNSVLENAVAVSGKADVDGNVSGGFILDSDGSADRNAVALSGGTVRGDVFGGRAFKGSASDNTVTISGGTIKGDGRTVYAGYVHRPEHGRASGNVVTISDSPGLETVTLRGNNLPSWQADGNALYFKGFRGSIRGLSHFQYVHVDKDSSVTVTGEGPHELFNLDNAGRMVFQNGKPAIIGKASGNPVEQAP